MLDVGKVSTLAHLQAYSEIKDLPTTNHLENISINYDTSDHTQAMETASKRLTFQRKFIARDMQDQNPWRPI